MHVCVRLYILYGHFLFCKTPLSLPPSHYHSLSPLLLLHTYLYPDASFTLHNVYQVTSTLDYFDLSDCLKVPDSVYVQIKANPSYPTEEKRREAVISYYLNTIPLASWVRIAGWLYYWEKHDSLEAVRKYLHHTTG